MKTQSTINYKTDERYIQIDEKSRIITDKLGCKIDSGIRELVVLLNYLGIGTIQSCQGHKNWGLNYPWIDIRIDFLENLEPFIQNLDIDVEISIDRIRITPKEKNLELGRKIFNKLKNNIKNKLK